MAKVKELTIPELKKDTSVAGVCDVPVRVQFLRDNGYPVTKENMLDVDLPAKPTEEEDEA